MERPTECEIVQDLMPFCAARTASRASTRLVLEHIKQCEMCRDKYHSLGQRRLKRWRGKSPVEETGSPARYFRWSLIALNALAALLCMAVNTAVDGRPTWAWIVAGAMVCGCVPTLVYLRAATQRFLKAMACFSVLGLLLLGLIQLVLHDLMGVTGVWVWRVALPVAAIYLAVIWTSVLVSRWRDWNGFVCIGMILLLCLPAEIAVTAIATGYSGGGMTFRWLNAVCYVLSSVAMFATGVWFELRGRKK